MAVGLDTSLLDVLLDSWDRNNTILVNLLRALPPGGLDIRPKEDSPSVGQLFAHMHYVRLTFVAEDAPEAASAVPKEEWVNERDTERMAQMLNDSARVVREAVQGRIETGRTMDLHFDHPVLLFQQMIWHEGYHYGQIKLALKMAGQPLSDNAIGPLSWGIWMRKSSAR